MQDDVEKKSGAAHWLTFDGHLNIGHLITTLTLAASIFVWGSAMDRRVAVLEERARVQEQVDSRQDSSAAAAVLLLRNDFADLRGEVRETNRKLERLVERGAK